MADDQDPFASYGDFVADCPARLAVDLFASGWLPVVVYTLRAGPLRPGELRGRIGGISHKVLTQTLRRMEGYGLVQRRRYAEAPPRVEYELTPPGRDLLVPIYALGQWAHRHAETVLGALDSAT
ncbi:helix-turn-helix transcriptional regulator [Planosporangium thailandense]|uniref:Helix-turn-helix transcriptional regulator n=1 Tax=Planosporangium thailandense TaxID=765197 RepID=A0ABX0Y1A8_9ACTN|nr:helix-turn-helix domain-containing protein [Planosporangium thailandense]NJC71198.1 helix-turn-helix transcriptional regulator [Planosporangium thailandense]